MNGCCAGLPATRATLQLPAGVQPAQQPLLLQEEQLHSSVLLAAEGSKPRAVTFYSTDEGVKAVRGLGDVLDSPGVSEDEKSRALITFVRDRVRGQG